MSFYFSTAAAWRFLGETWF